MHKVKIVLGLFFLFSLISCEQEKQLPILGEKVIDEVTGETRDYQAPVFKLTNQLNQTTSNQEFAQKIQVVDFFFTSCGSICPIMTQNLTLVQEAFKDEERVHILSYSIDPELDTPKQLKQYAQNYQINPQQWSLLTGKQETILELAKDYKVRAFKDDMIQEERNLLHDGTFVLVDAQRRIRGYYNGLEVEDVNKLIDDIRTLLKE